MGHVVKVAIWIRVRLVPIRVKLQEVATQNHLHNIFTIISATEKVVRNARKFKKRNGAVDSALGS